jgi:pimeloyl-ACP methyl ester carboxylesterase
MRSIASRYVRFWLAIASLLTLVISATVYYRLPGGRRPGIFDSDPPTPYLHYTPTGTLRGRVLVIHGLDSSSHVMNLMCYGLADAGFEVFSIDFPGHGESRASFNAVRARDVAGQVLDKLGPETAVLGHSFGGGVLLDLADERPIRRMVLFSPAPTPLQRLKAEHILVYESQFEPGRIRAFAAQVESSATGTYELRELAWSGHSSGLFKPHIIASVAEWLGGNPAAIRTRARLGLLLLMLLSSGALGLVLLFRVKRVRVGGEAPPLRVSVLHYTVAAIVAAAVFAVVNVTAWLRIFAMDYLIGVFFMVGVLVVTRCGKLMPTRPRLWIGVAAAAYVILIMGTLVTSELFHSIVSGERWWRFPAILALSLPMFLADEHLLRPLRPGIKAAAGIVVTRLVLGAVIVSGALILNRDAAFLLLLAHLAVIFWIGLWFASGLVRKRTDPITAACFAAIVQAWYFAALFVMT